jgi:hypothetical protein
MPWGDCTGPWWMGRRMDRVAGYTNPYCRRSFGRGFGYARGFDYAYEPFRQPTPEEEMSYLETMARNLEEDLKSVRDQIEKLRSRA